MNNIPCFRDSEENRFPEEGEEEVSPVFYHDRSRQYAADIESSKHITITGLTMMWGNWSAMLPKRLPNLLHGYLMCSPFNFMSPEYKEIRFLIDIAEALADDK